MPNRLAGESSPYLQQHADNPVDWWPWSQEAFDEARRRDVPVFLSIGYATCHWCHVMAHESFEDEEVARRMNAAFLNIKVDREERPDIDEIYMAACQAMTGHGGWPLTVLLDHEKRPWFAGTYFPKQSRGGRIGMLDFVPAAADAWHAKRDQIDHQAQHLVSSIQDIAPRPGPAPDAEVLEQAAQAVARSYDEEHGGFAGAPKFPSLHIVRFLLRRHLDGDRTAWSMAHRTLHAMARGGIRDLVGGGFHRYSTDARWHLPHFEKMLYDQAMALWTYAEAHRLAPDPVFERVIRDTADYLARDLRHPDGAFFAAEDADSEGEEGLFYTWPWAELGAHVDAGLARALGAVEGGNFHDEASGEPAGRSILFAHQQARLGDDLVAAWEGQRQQLLEARAQRVRPLRDEKVLADWNGLAIAGLAAASLALAEPRLARLAEAAAKQVLLRMRHDGMLRHAWTHGRLGNEAFLEDQAAMARGLLVLYEATWQPRWLAAADAILARLDVFAAGGAYHRTAKDAEELVARPIESHDGAIPSGNTLAAEAWLHHGRLTGRPDSLERAEAVLEAFGGSLREHPRALLGMAAVAADRLAPWCEIIVEAPDGHPLLEAARRVQGPRCHVLRHDAELAALVSLLPPATGRPVAYLCTGDACGPPLHEPSALEAAVAKALAPRATGRETAHASR